MINNKIYTLFSFEDNEIKDVFSSRKEAEEWVSEYRKGREDDIRIEEWTVSNLKEEKQ